MTLDIQSMFELWLEKGVDGILLADIEVLLEAADPTLDEPQPEEEDEGTSKVRPHFQYHTLILAFSSGFSHHVGSPV